MSGSFEDNARALALKAVELDRNNQHELAISYYMEASQALINAKKLSNSPVKYDEKIDQYLTRAENLKKNLNTNSPKGFVQNSTKSELEKDLERVVCMLTDALDLDSEGNHEDALELYMSAIELFLKKKSNNNNVNIDKFGSLEAYIKRALNRAEEIKGMKKDNSSPIARNTSETNLNTSDNSPQPSSQGASSFTREELAVLRYGSRINTRDYVPFLPDIDLKEKFYFQIQYTDRDGFLALSSSQKDRFSRWARPDEIFDQPKLMMLVSSFSVKQTCISDCSFIASLTVCAQFERKFNKVLIPKIIYPQNKNGEPVINPCGKYMVILNINGCNRKVVIDDYLPVDKYNNLLCSMTTNKGELWVSLLEKAYMKVMGGYDFPGSNSNIDLHALTGWIPERVSMHNEHTEFKKDEEFDRMFERFHMGDCLITVATGPISSQEEERTGLVSTHAYACLDIRKFKNTRLFQIKNPWSHIRWKGRFSENDSHNWTEELKKALNYDPHMACNVDNGVFWIDYESLIKFFDVFYLSWNPRIFPYTSVIHRKWAVHEGPARDLYNLGENPQHVLKVRPQGNSTRTSTWVLLTRHIVDKDDFAQNKEYITLIVYKSNGKRVFYPSEPAPFKEGVRINSPHYLVKLVDSQQSVISYTLVVSQYEKSSSIYYSLRVFSTAPFELNELKDNYNPKYLKEVTGKWVSGKTAGGCSNFPETYKNNPLYQIDLNNNESKNCIKIELKGPQAYSVGFDVLAMNKNVNDGREAKFSSGNYRKGFSVLELENIAGGRYQIRPTTFLQNQEGPFFLSISSSHAYQLTQLQ